MTDLPSDQDVRRAIETAVLMANVLALQDFDAVILALRALAFPADSDFAYQAFSLRNDTRVAEAAAVFVEAVRESVVGASKPQRVTHILKHDPERFLDGQAFCGKGMPGEWSRDEQWISFERSDDFYHVTCLRCIRNYLAAQSDEPVSCGEATP
jgi:hypothetical protein